MNVLMGRSTSSLRVSISHRATLSLWASRVMLLGGLLVASGAAGCAAENKLTKRPNFSLSHPDFWKVQTVASKEGEPTKLTIGKYSETAVTDGAGATNSAIYESSQAEIDARIFTWKGVDDGGAPAKKVADLIFPVAPDLELNKQGRVSTDKGECGAQFTKKFLMFKQTSDPLDLLSRPGFRTIIVGAKSDDVLVGVVTRVPYEQDGGLYCHNLTNMQMQLQLLLEGLTVVPTPAAAPAAPAAPPTLPPPALMPPAGPAPAAARRSPFVRRRDPVSSPGPRRKLDLGDFLCHGFTAPDRAATAGSGRRCR